MSDFVLLYSQVSSRAGSVCDPKGGRHNKTKRWVTRRVEASVKAPGAIATPPPPPPHPRQNAERGKKQNNFFLTAEAEPSHGCRARSYELRRVHESVTVESCTNVTRGITQPVEHRQYRNGLRTLTRLGCGSGKKKMGTRDHRFSQFPILHPHVRTPKAPPPPSPAQPPTPVRVKSCGSLETATVKRERRLVKGGREMGS